jgi:alpha-N-arabinofuranosidase
VDAIAARDKSGKLWLALVNVDPNRATKVSAALAGVKATYAKGEILTAAAVDAHNSFESANDVAPKPFSGRASGGQLQFDLPPKAIAVVEVR